MKNNLPQHKNKTRLARSEIPSHEFELVTEPCDLALLIKSVNQNFVLQFA